jgi:hypothetical protein
MWRQQDVHPSLPGIRELPHDDRRLGPVAAKLAGERLGELLEERVLPRGEGEDQLRAGRAHSGLLFAGRGELRKSPPSALNGLVMRQLRELTTAR